MGPVSVLLPPDLAADAPFVLTLEEMLFEWREPREGLLRVHGIERTREGIVILTGPPPPIAFRDAVTVAREVELGERIVWGATRIGDACRAVSTLSGPHRSLTPETVAFDIEGRVCVMPAITRVIAKRQITGAGKIRGNIRYLSPEHAKALPLDERSDVYQLAHLLRCLLGAPPLFARPRELETLMAIISREPIPRLRDEGIDVPAALDSVIHAALTCDQRDRPSLRELEAAILPCADAARARASTIPTRAREIRRDGKVENPLAALFEGPIWKPCKKTWEELTVTAEPAVRDCADCKLSVQRARTTLELAMIGGGCAFWDPKPE
jgi:hypothetical protein